MNLKIGLVAGLMNPGQVHWSRKTEEAASTTPMADEGALMGRNWLRSATETGVFFSLFPSLTDYLYHWYSSYPSTRVNGRYCSVSTLFMTIKSPDFIHLARFTFVFIFLLWFKWDINKLMLIFFIDVGTCLVQWYRLGQHSQVPSSVQTWADTSSGHTSFWQRHPGWGT